jgi:hypothetical protein
MLACKIAIILSVLGSREGETVIVFSDTGVKVNVGDMVDVSSVLVTTTKVLTGVSIKYAVDVGGGVDVEVGTGVIGVTRKAAFMPNIKRIDMANNNKSNATVGDINVLIVKNGFFTVVEGIAVGIGTMFKERKSLSKFCVYFLPCKSM